MDFSIEQQWDGSDTDHDEITMSLRIHQHGIQVNVTAPLFNDPPAPTGVPSGKACPQLWDYEVVEAFFLAPDEKYLEVELSPHGQHLVLLLNGCRKIMQDQLPLEYMVAIDGDTWQGEAIIPVEYFPVGANKFNAYAIHGSGEDRMYEALYAAPHGKYTQPDFHRLEYFKELDLQSLLPGDSRNITSDLWKMATL